MKTYDELNLAFPFILKKLKKTYFSKPKKAGGSKQTSPTIIRPSARLESTFKFNYKSK